MPPKAQSAIELPRLKSTRSQYNIPTEPMAPSTEHSIINAIRFLRPRESTQKPIGYEYNRDSKNDDSQMFPPVLPIQAEEGNDAD